MAPLDVKPVHPTAPATPVRRVETGEQRQPPPRRRPGSPPPATESDTVDAQGHIDTHV